MTNILAIRQTLSTAGPYAAERALAVIGDNQGDDQLAILVRELSHGEVSQLLGEGDYSKPSVVAHHITPAQLLGALQRLGAQWGSLKGMEIEGLLSIKEQVRDFMLSALLHGNEETQKELFETILENSLAEDVIVMIALFEFGCPEFLKEKDWATAQMGTWQELYMRIRDLLPAAFRQLSKEVTSLFGKTDDDEDEEAATSKKAERFLRRVLQSLAEKAEELTENAASTQKKPKEIFEDL